MGGMFDFIHNKTEFTVGPLTLDEMIKLLSVINNPDEATNVRKALRFYMPSDTEATNPVADLLPTLRKYSCPYGKDDLATLSRFSAGAKAILLVDAGVGGVLKHMAAAVPKGTVIVVVEGVSGVPEYVNPKASLKETCRQLSLMGATVHLFLGDSTSQQLVACVEAYAPFDFAYINGDKAVFDNYVSMSLVTGVSRTHAALWEYVTSSGLHAEEAGNIGIVYRE